MKKFLKLTAKLLCFFGCLFQLVDIIQLYLNYQVITEVSIELSNDFSSPILKLCLYKRDVIELSNAHRKRQLDDLLSELTIAQIFKFSPKASDIIANCSLREEDLAFESYDHYECNKHFTIKRYQQLHFACYGFNPVLHKDKHFGFNLGYALDSTNILYQLNLNMTSLQRARFVKPILIRTYDDFAFPFSPLIAIEKDSNLKEARNDFTIFNTILETQKLEKPYSPFCLNYARINFKGRLHCLYTCQAETLKQFNKEHYSTAFIDGSSSSVLNSKDIYKNESNRRQLSRITTRCNNLCKADDCIIRSSITHLHSKETGKDIRFQISMPVEPSIVVKYLAKMQMSELMIYLLSVLGTWFGISVLGSAINLINVFSRERMKPNYESRFRNLEREMKKLKRRHY